MKLTDTYLDDLFRKAIRLRDNYDICPICRNPFGHFRRPEVCHWQGRRYLKTRWDMDNAILGCSICNTICADFEHILRERGVDTDMVRFKAKSFGKPERDLIAMQLKMFIANVAQKY